MSLSEALSTKNAFMLIFQLRVSLLPASRLMVAAAAVNVQNKAHQHSGACGVIERQAGTAIKFIIKSGCAPIIPFIISPLSDQARVKTA